MNKQAKNAAKVLAGLLLAILASAIIGPAVSGVWWAGILAPIITLAIFFVIFAVSVVIIGFGKAYAERTSVKDETK